jgi:hypothetical protein
MACAVRMLRYTDHQSIYLNNNFAIAIACFWRKTLFHRLRAAIALCSVLHSGSFCIFDEKTSLQRFRVIDDVTHARCSATQKVMRIPNDLCQEDQNVYI